MIKEAYCSFEVSNILKEKGFNTPCSGRYSVRSKEFHLDCTKMCNNGGLFECAAPTHQMAMAWLREKYGIFIAINNDDLDFNWQCYDLINRGSTLDPKILSESYGGFKYYENAVEAALKYVLENLI